MVKAGPRPRVVEAQALCDDLGITERFRELRDIDPHAAEAFATNLEYRLSVLLADARAWAETMRDRADALSALKRGR
jgi:hypothetical protein